MSDYIMRLIQRRLLDKNSEITQEEIIKAQEQISIRLLYLQKKIEVLESRQKMLKRLIKKESLYL